MINSWMGIILGIGGIIIGQLLEGGEMRQLLQPTAALIVCGGTLGATMLSTTMGDFSQAIRYLPKVFFGGNHDYVPLVKEIVSIASVARREGILALERSVGEIKNPFFSSNLRHIIDGYDANVMEQMMEDRISKEEEHRAGVAKVWEVAGGFSPTVGIIGAVLGLIHVMANLSDSSKLGSGIAVAFVATVYGVGMANLFLLPVGNKLKKIGKEEMEEFELIYAGLTGMQAGLNPRVIEDRLMNILGHNPAEGGAEAVGAEKESSLIMSRRKKHAEEHENLERWLVSYADFITLLFAFFTVMYALSVSDKAKYRATLENIQRSFLSAGGVFPLKGTPMIPFEKAPDQGSEVPPSPSDMGKMPRASSDADDKLTQQIRTLFKETTGLGLPSGQVEVVQTSDGFKIRLGEQMLFSPGSDKLKRQDIPFLYEMGKRLKRLNLPIQIGGHSDSTPFAKKSTNWQLSISRAYNVVQFLVQGTDFPAQRVSLAGYGDTQPLADNATEEGRARNRRVEISLITPDHNLPDLPW